MFEAAVEGNGTGKAAAGVEEGMKTAKDETVEEHASFMSPPKQRAGQGKRLVEIPRTLAFGREELRVLRMHRRLVKRPRMVLERAPNNLAIQGFD